MKAKLRIFTAGLLLGGAVLACNFPTLKLDANQVTPSPVVSEAVPGQLVETLQPVTATVPITQTTPVTPESSPTAAIAYSPVFEPAPCDFAVPAGTRPECGYLVVPEDRGRADSPSIRLYVAIFRSRSASPAPGPVIHLAGGPGSSSLEVAGYMLRQGMDGILERRDFILFDQRGTGSSIPRLDCPEREQITPLLLADYFTSEASSRLIIDSFRRCRERLISEGIDITAYHSAASAADVNDLRLALGLGPVNLYGVSYGTRLALTVMRDFPEAVRSAVLDSAYPPQVHLYTTLAPNAERAFNVFFQRCADNPVCSQATPNLKEVFYGLVDRLNQSPVQVGFWADGQHREAILNGHLLIDVLLVGLYNPAVSATMPEMIYDIQQGEYGILRERLSLYYSASAIGLTMSVQCREEIPFSPIEEAFSAAAGVQPQIAAFFPRSVQPLFSVCQEWSAGTLDPRENQPVSSHVPALVMTGGGDPITPPSWGLQAVETLSQGHFYEFPGSGHWVTRSSRCAVQMALQFWENPFEAPDSSCISGPGG